MSAPRSSVAAGLGARLGAEQRAPFIDHLAEIPSALGLDLEMFARCVDAHERLLVEVPCASR